MEEVIKSGLIIDLIIIVMGIEMLVFFFIKIKTGYGPLSEEYIYHQLAGLFLLLALRSSLTSASWVLVANGLLGSFVCHLFYLRTLWKSRSKNVLPTEPSRNTTLFKNLKTDKRNYTFMKIGRQP